MSFDTTRPYRFSGVFSMNLVVVHAGVTRFFQSVLSCIEKSMCPDIFRNDSLVRSKGGVLILGGRDESLYQGDLTYIPVIKNDSWTVNLTR